MSKFEERLSMLEMLIGLDKPFEELNSADGEETKKLADIALRVQNLCDGSKTRLKNHSNSSASQENDLDEFNLNSIEQNLDIPPLLLASASSTATSSGEVNDSKPLVYRKQEVLARSEELGNALEQMATIRDLMCVSNPKLLRELQILRQSKGNELSMEHVGNAPILISSPLMIAGAAQNQEKLMELSEKVVNIHKRAAKVTSKCDAIIGTYYKLIFAVNEKLILNQEER